MEPPPQPTDAIKPASKNRKPQMRGENRMKTPNLNVFRRGARLLLGCIESKAATVTIASKTAHFYTQKCIGSCPARRRRHQGNVPNRLPVLTLISLVVVSN